MSRSLEVHVSVVVRMDIEPGAAPNVGGSITIAADDVVVDRDAVDAELRFDEAPGAKHAADDIVSRLLNDGREAQASRETSVKLKAALAKLLASLEAPAPEGGAS